MSLLRKKGTRKGNVLLFQFFEGLRIRLPNALFVLRRRLFPILLRLIKNR